MFRLEKEEEMKQIMNNFVQIMKNSSKQMKEQWTQFFNEEGL